MMGVWSSRTEQEEDGGGGGGGGGRGSELPNPQYQADVEEYSCHIQKTCETKFSPHNLAEIFENRNINSQDVCNVTSEKSPKQEISNYLEKVVKGNNSIDLGAAKDVANSSEDESGVQSSVEEDQTEHKDRISLEEPSLRMSR